MDTNLAVLLKGIWLVFWSVLVTIVEPFLPKRFLHKDVRNQIVLITGAASGFGRLLATKFAVDHGSIVVLWDINKSGLEQTMEEVKAGGGRSHSYVVDVSSKEAIAAASKLVQMQVGKVDILINNAGVGDAELLVKSDDAMIEKTFSINILAHYWITKIFLPAMIKDRKGHVVTISSVSGLLGGAALTCYSGTKFACVGFHESLTSEIKLIYPDSKIATTLICPYMARTPIMTHVEDVIPSTIFLPIRDVEPVVQEMVDAILTNQNILVPTYGIRFLMFIKSNLPSRVTAAITDLGLALLNPEEVRRIVSIVTSRNRWKKSLESSTNN